MKLCHCQSACYSLQRGSAYCSAKYDSLLSWLQNGGTGSPLTEPQKHLTSQFYTSTHKSSCNLQPCLESQFLGEMEVLTLLTCLISYAFTCLNTPNSKMWMLHAHVQPSSTEELYNQHSFKVSTQY